MESIIEKLFRILVRRPAIKTLSAAFKTTQWVLRFNPFRSVYDGERVFTPSLIALLIFVVLATLLLTGLGWSVDLILLLTMSMVMRPYVESVVTRSFLRQLLQAATLVGSMAASTLLLILAVSGLLMPVSCFLMSKFNVHRLGFNRQQMRFGLLLLILGLIIMVLIVAMVVKEITLCFARRLASTTETKPRHRSNPDVDIAMALQDLTDLEKRTRSGRIYGSERLE